MLAGELSQQTENNNFPDPNVNDGTSNQRGDQTRSLVDIGMYLLISYSYKPKFIKCLNPKKEICIFHLKNIVSIYTLH